MSRVGTTIILSEKGSKVKTKLAELVLLAALVPLLPLLSATEIDCALSACGFGSRVDTLTTLESINPFDGVTMLSETVTDVYFSAGVYTYAYEETLSANIPVEIPSVLVIGFYPFQQIIQW